MVGILKDRNVIQFVRSIHQDLADIAVAIGKEDRDTALYWLDKVERNLNLFRRILEGE